MRNARVQFQGLENKNFYLHGRFVPIPATVGERVGLFCQRHAEEKYHSACRRPSFAHQFCAAGVLCIFASPLMRVAATPLSKRRRCATRQNRLVSSRRRGTPACARLVQTELVQADQAKVQSSAQSAQAGLLQGKQASEPIATEVAASPIGCAGTDAEDIEEKSCEMQHADAELGLANRSRKGAEEYIGPAMVWPSRPPPKAGKRRLRGYQERAVALFFQKAHLVAAEGRPMRFQMACGTGKTFVYCSILGRDLRSAPRGKHVVFVPWIDLAWQTVEELTLCGIRACILGDGRFKVDPLASVVVCVYASAPRLRGQQFRIKICDEAHHLEPGHGSGWCDDIRAGVSAEVTADFSATFRKLGQTIDFRYDLDRSIEDGVVSNIMLTMASLPITRHDQDHLPEIVKHIAAHRDEWAPMFVLLNKRQRGLECAELLRSRCVNAVFLDSTMTSDVRSAAVKKLRNKQLHALCLVGLFNEGTSIDELRTVVFADLRQGRINTQQACMRVTRKHPSKSHGNVVLPVRYDWTSEHKADVMSMVKILCAMSTRLTKCVQGLNSGWLRVVSLPGDDGDAIVDAASLQTEMLQRLCYTFCRGLADFHMRCDVLREWLERHDGKWPSQASTDEAELTIASWVSRIQQKHRKGTLTDVQLAKLHELPGISDVMLKWKAIARRPSNFRDRVRQLREWMEAHRSQLPKRKSPCKEERQLAEWLKDVKGKNKNGQIKGHDRMYLLAIPAIREMLGEEDCANNETTFAPPLWEQRFAALQDWVRAHSGAMPRYSSGPGEERELAIWLDYVMDTVQKGTATERQLGLLRKLPGQPRAPPTSPTRTNKRRSWEESAEHVREWLHVHDALPRHRSKDVEERRLCGWIDRTIKDLKRKHLTQQQVDKLREIPGMAERVSLEQHC